LGTIHERVVIERCNGEYSSCCITLALSGPAFLWKRGLGPYWLVLPRKCAFADLGLVR